MKNEINTNQSFSMLPNELASEHGYTVAGIYARLLNECNPPNYEILMSIPTLSKKFGISGRNLIRTIKKLEELHIVERITKDGGINRYKIVPIVNARLHHQPAPASETPEQSERYGRYQHVLLSASQYSELVEAYGESKINTYIQRADDYCQQTGKTYQDYAVTIRTWIEQDKEKAKKSGRMSEEELQGYLSLVNRWDDDEDYQVLKRQNEIETFLKSKPVEPTIYRMTDEELNRCLKGEWKFILLNKSHPFYTLSGPVELLEIAEKWKKYYEEIADWQKRKDELYPELSTEEDI